MGVEAAFVLVELACSLALKVDLVDLGHNLADDALIDADVGEAQQRLLVVIIDVGQAGAWRLTVALKDCPRSLAIADGGGVNLLKNFRAGDIPAYKAK
eukprot:5128417-Pleurochrysis_carterae.AAC.1